MSFDESALIDIKRSILGNQACENERCHICFSLGLEKLETVFICTIFLLFLGINACCPYSRMIIFIESFIGSCPYWRGVVEGASTVPSQWKLDLGITNQSLV